MKVLLDTNVVLDVLLKRPSFYQNSFEIFRLIDQERIDGCITASAITDIFYIAKKETKDAEMVYQAIEKLTDIFSIIPVSKNTIANALVIRWKDFEDAVQFMAAKENGIAYIITRNKNDFESPEIPCIEPLDFIVHFNENK